MTQSGGYLSTWDRLAIMYAIEESAGVPLSATDPLPDTLIACAQALGLAPAELRMWMYDAHPRDDWSTASLARWAVDVGLRKEAETEAGHA
jgi:hypothetical protein